MRHFMRFFFLFFERCLNPFYFVNEKCGKVQLEETDLLSQQNYNAFMRKRILFHYIKLHKASRIKSAESNRTYRNF